MKQQIITRIKTALISVPVYDPVSRCKQFQLEAINGFPKIISDVLLLTSPLNQQQKIATAITSILYKQNQVTDKVHVTVDAKNIKQEATHV